MKAVEYAAHDAVGIAELIRTRQVSAEEVQDAARQAIGQVNPQLNALVAPVFDRPLAYDASGPLAGVPFALKDIGAHAQGVPQTMGSRITGAGLVYDDDTDLMARFRRAGLATLCRTSVPEFGFNFSAEAASNGPTRNPWDVARTAGGSSGGAAALVAAGAVPIAHANDGGGSIRCPASWCGLVGLKPSRGRTPLGPGQAEPLLGYGAEFVLTRTVRDCAVALDAVAGAGVGERFVLPPPSRPYGEEVAHVPRGLRIAFMTQPWNDAKVDPAHVEAVHKVARVLESAGHVITEARPDLDPIAFDTASTRIWAGVIGHWMREATQLTGRAVSAEHIEAVNLSTFEYGRALSAFELLEAQDIVNATTRRIARWFLDFDVLLSPTMAVPPPQVGYMNMQDARHDVATWWKRMMSVGPFTAVWNMTGAPALSLPLGETSDGLPIGVQFVGRYLDESTLLCLAAYLEQVMPWSERTPRLRVG